MVVDNGYPDITALLNSYAEEHAVFYRSVRPRYEVVNGRMKHFKVLTVPFRPQSELYGFFLSHFTCYQLYYHIRGAVIPIAVTFSTCSCFLFLYKRHWRSRIEAVLISEDGNARMSWRGRRITEF